MLKNYFKVAVRNLRRWKGYAAINVFGLATGLACFVLIALFVHDELSYDRYHAKADRIYRMVEVIEGAEESASNPLPVGAAVAETYPQFVEAAVRFFNLQAPTLAISYEPADGPARAFNEAKFFFADSTVFDVFDFALVRGDRETALDRPNTVFSPESAAQRYFGDADPIGKTLLFEEQHPLEVTGVLAEVPATSHFTFDFLASFSTLRSSVYAQNAGILDFNWYWNPAWTYVLLRDGVAPGRAGGAVPRLHRAELAGPDQGAVGPLPPAADRHPPEVQPRLRDPRQQRRPLRLRLLAHRRLRAPHGVHQLHEPLDGALDEPGEGGRHAEGDRGAEGPAHRAVPERVDPAQHGVARSSRCRSCGCCCR